MMRKLITFLSIILFVGCSRQRPKKISFLPELTIGRNEDIEGAWFGSLNTFYVDRNENIYCVDWQEGKIKIFDNRL